MCKHIIDDSYKYIAVVTEDCPHKIKWAHDKLFCRKEDCKKCKGD